MNTIFDAFFFLIRVFILYVIYSTAKHLASKSKCHNAKAYLWAIGISAFLAGMSWVNYGTHTEDADPLKGGGESVVDFEPTKDQRNRHGIFIFTVLALVSVVGTYQGFKNRQIQDK